MDEYSHPMEPSLEAQIRRDIQQREDSCLSEFAAKSIYGIRRKGDKPEDIRACYSRDADRILHTHAYSRYVDKTQVFFCVDNDHVTHRVLHVQMVSKIGRTIGRALRLNEDLIEAIAIGHDIGHTAFGHMGEECLSAICIEKEIGRFCHNVQSIQFLDTIENRNLTLQVLDGILSHNGETKITTLKPNYDKTWEDFDSEINRTKNEDVRSTQPPIFSPKTMEACVIRFADVISYLGRDIEDAIELGLLQDNSSIPANCAEKLGTKNSDIINTLIQDLVTTSYGHDYIGFSEGIAKAAEELRDFNYRSIYMNPLVVSDRPKIERLYRILFEDCLNDLDGRIKESKIMQHFSGYEWIRENKEYWDNTNNAEKVRDYVAGMTDRYFEAVAREKLLPERKNSFK